MKCSKSRRFLGLCPRPRWGSLQRSPRPASRKGLLAFRNHNFAPSARAISSPARTYSLVQPHTASIPCLRLWYLAPPTSKCWWRHWPCSRLKPSKRKILVTSLEIRYDIFLYKLWGIKFQSSFNGREKLYTLVLNWYLCCLGPGRRLQRTWSKLVYIAWNNARSALLSRSQALGSALWRNVHLFIWQIRVSICSWKIWDSHDARSRKVYNN